MKSWHIILLSLWLVLSGIFALFKISSDTLITIMVIVEIAAGVLLFLAGKKIKVFHHLGALLLALFLVFQGLFMLFNIQFSGSPIILGILAFVAALFLFMGLRGKKGTFHLGAIFMAIWLVMTGLMLAIDLKFNGMDVVMAILAIIAGVLLHLGQKKK